LCQCPDFQSLEQDVELRKAGVEKMYSVSKEYSKHLTRKLEAEGTDTGKVLPIDGLGLIMANHGEEFGSDSSFGRSITPPHFFFSRKEIHFLSLEQQQVKHYSHLGKLNSRWPPPPPTLPTT
jgi:hypothetical protein